MKFHGEYCIMLDSNVTLGCGSHFLFCEPDDLVPAILAHARIQGPTNASWVRMVILAALDRESDDNQRKVA